MRSGACLWAQRFLPSSFTAESTTDVPQESVGEGSVQSKDRWQGWGCSVWAFTEELLFRWQVLNSVYAQKSMYTELSGTGLLLRHFDGWRCSELPAAETWLKGPLPGPKLRAVLSCADAGAEVGHPAQRPQLDLDLAKVGGRMISLRHQPGTRLPSLCPAAQVNGPHCSLVLGVVLVFREEREWSISWGRTSGLPRDTP